MAKKENQKRKQELAERKAVESLVFQVHYGLRMLGREDNDLFHKLAEAEIEFISRLGLTQDILNLKKLIDGVKIDLLVEPMPESGDLCTSVSAIALGIARIQSLEQMNVPVSWESLINQKILNFYYAENIRNQVVEWAKSNGFTTSTYLGNPIVKFNKIHIILRRQQ